jgi:hypothetical protein
MHPFTAETLGFTGFSITDTAEAALMMTLLRTTLCRLAHLAIHPPLSVR